MIWHTDRTATNVEGHLVDELYDDQLEDVPEGVDLVDAGGEVAECALLVRVDEHHKCVALAWHVLLPLKEVADQFRRVRDQKVKIPDKWEKKIGNYYS